MALHVRFSGVRPNADDYSLVMIVPENDFGFSIMAAYAATVSGDVNLVYCPCRRKASDYVSVSELELWREV